MTASLRPGPRADLGLIWNQQGVASMPGIIAGHALFTAN
jgi:hypothetical protein